MKYSVNLKAKFSEEPVCYLCYPKKDKNAVLYEVNMTGIEKATSEFRLTRQGYHTFLLSYTLRGGVTLKYNGQTYRVKEGDLFFINCDDFHEFIPDSDGWEFTYIHLSGLGIKYVYDEFVTNTGYVYENYPKKVFLKQLEKIRKRLNVLPCKREGYTRHVEIDKEKTLCLLSREAYTLLTDVTENLVKVKQDLPYEIKKGLNYIREHYCEKITIGQVAEYVCLSKFCFMRHFEKYLKTSVYQYINELRLERSKWLLETTDLKVLDIAIEVGYSDLQGLNKLFLKHTGVTPSQFRKEIDHYAVNHEFKK